MFSAITAGCPSLKCLECQASISTTYIRDIILITVSINNALKGGDSVASAQLLFLWRDYYESENVVT